MFERELGNLFGSISISDLSTQSLSRIEQAFRGIAVICKSSTSEAHTAFVENAAQVDELLSILTVSALTSSDETARHDRACTSILYHIFDSLLQIFGNANFTAAALLEFVNQDSTVACYLLAAVLRSKEGSLEAHLLASHLAIELTAASSVYTGSEDVSGMNISDLTAKYNAYVAKLLDAVISADLIDSFGRCVCFHQRDHATTDVLISDFCKLVVNLLSFSSEKQRVFRTHLAQSGLISDIFFPYIENVLPVLLTEAVESSRIEWKTLTGVLRLLAIVSFKIKLFKKRIQASTFFLELLEVRGLENHPFLVLALLQLALNSDFSTAPFWPEFFACLHAFVNEKLDAHNKARIASKLAKPDAGVPMLLSAQCKDAIFELFEVKESKLEPGTKVAEPNSQPQFLVEFVPVRISSELSAQLPVNPEVAIAPAVTETAASAPDLPPLPADSVCALTGAPVVHAVMSPCGHTLEWLAKSPMCPVDGKTLTPAELVDGGSGKSAKTDKVQEAVLKQKLGISDLPPLVSQPGQPWAAGAGKGKLKVNRNLAALDSAPVEFKCALDGKLMVNPVRSPVGHVFEKKTLEKWMEAVGSVCPVTEKPLRLEDCLPHSELKKTITKWLKEQGLLGKDNNFFC